jgi:hypothetical protein
MRSGRSGNVWPHDGVAKAQSTAQNNDELFFLAFNVNKGTLTLNLRSDEARRIAGRSSRRRAYPERRVVVGAVWLAFPPA